MQDLPLETVVREALREIRYFYLFGTPIDNGSYAFELVRRASVMDDAALGELLSKINEQLLAKRLLARLPKDKTKQEQLQEAAFRLLGVFRHPEKEKRFRAETFRGYWAFFNAVIRSILFRWGKRPDDDDLTPTTVAPTPPPNDFGGLQIYVNRLPEQQRLCVELRYRFDLKPREIAEMYRAIDPETTAKQISRYLQFAMKNLRKWAGSDDNE